MTSYVVASSRRPRVAAMRAITSSHLLDNEGAVPPHPAGRLSFLRVCSSTTEVLEQQWLLRIQSGGRG